MYVNPVDGKIIAKANTVGLKREYINKYGKSFPHFNYKDFPNGANQYLDALRAALLKK